MKQRALLPLSETARRTAREEVYRALRRGILGGAIEAGARLVQTEVAEALGVSTTPVREALRDLSSEGLVQFDDYRGAVVQRPSLEDIREIYRLRIILEPAAIRESVGNLTRADLDRAARLQRRMDREENLGEWVELNNEFHSVFDDARSPRTNTILRNLRDSATLVVGLSNRVGPRLVTASNRQHHLLLDVCRNRDGEAAARILEEHVRETLEAMEQYFRESQDTLSPPGSWRSSR